MHLPTRAVKNTLGVLADNLLSGAPEGNIVEPWKSCQEWQMDEAIGLIETLSDDYVSTLEKCHAELKKREFL